ncbi:hypothetical protein X777_04272 [Ooceraea biroi]|uniref:Uncharacterized protein n=1 Tax=Ooceraea biroi TaxID=2015173 RepID=A0A026WHL7_OOCBI|nr:hypothetical protein X777_04272 [Ooceraea biroi]
MSLHYAPTREKRVLVSFSCLSIDRTPLIFDKCHGLMPTLRLDTALKAISISKKA